MPQARRAYRMVKRAASSEATAARIYRAAGELFGERPFEAVTVRAVAERAGVTLQTVLRRFGSKDALFEAAGAALLESVMRARQPAYAGVRAAVETLVASYEEMGDLGWRGLTQEDRFPWVRARLDEARARHREWVERSFADRLPARGAARERRVLLLFAATDIYLWKLWRRDLGCSRKETVERMIDLVEAVAREAR
jgi:AcrR family transcriptional regulator